MKLRLSVLAACVVALAGCSGPANSPQPTASGGGGGGGGGDARPTVDCANWCDGGSATVTVKGQALKVSPGGCDDLGARGVDFRFGDFADQSANWVIGIVGKDGGAMSVSGRLNGQLFVLTDVTGSMSGLDSGTFSGRDSVGELGVVSGTFTCR